MSMIGSNPSEKVFSFSFNPRKEGIFGSSTFDVLISSRAFKGVVEKELVLQNLHLDFVYKTLEWKRLHSRCVIRSDSETPFHFLLHPSLSV